MDKIENRNWTLIDEMSEVHHLCAHHRSNTAKQLVRMKWATIEGWAKKKWAPGDETFSVKLNLKW